MAASSKLKARRVRASTPRVRTPAARAAAMKIGLVTHEYPPDVVGGVSRHTYLLARGLAASGHTVHVITLGAKNETVRQEDGVTVHRILHRSVYPEKGRLRETLRRMEYSLSVMTKVRALIGAREIEVLQAHPMGGELFLFSLQEHATVPIVTHLSTMYRELAACEGWRVDSDYQLSSWMEDETIMRSKALLAPSRACAVAVAERLRIDPDTITVIPHGIPLPDDDGPEEPSNGSGSAPQVLFVGRLERRKGAQTLMHAVPRVLARMPGVMFSLMGGDSFEGIAELARDGSARSSFKQQLLSELPSRYWPSVKFLGQCEDVVRERALKACDLFVAPSLHESFGFVYLEAMAYGKPVIGCRVGGVPEVVEDGVTGSLIPPGDEGALADTILRLLGDPEGRRMMGAAGRKAVESRFTVSQMVDRTTAVYERLLAHRP